MADIETTAEPTTLEQAVQGRLTSLYDVVALLDAIHDRIDSDVSILDSAPGHQTMRLAKMGQEILLEIADAFAVITNWDVSADRY